MAEITAQLVKLLRERTGVGMMDCKSALNESGGDLDAAEVILRKKGISKASGKLSRATKQGMIGSYIHSGSQLGVLIEINCESDFVARTEDFQSLLHDVSMQIAAADPRYLRREEIPPEVIAKELDIQKDRARGEGKPEAALDKIVQGRMNKFYEEVCLLEQPFIKDEKLKIEDLIKTKIAKLGENISIARFVRFKVGDTQPAEETQQQG